VSGPSAHRWPAAAAWAAPCIAAWLLALVGPVRAQVEPLGPLVVHLDEALAPLGGPLARALTRRTGRTVDVGAPTFGRTALLLPAGHVGLVRSAESEPARAIVTLVAEDGRVYETEVAVPPEGTSAAVRALSLAIVDLFDAALEAPELAEPSRIALGESAPLSSTSPSYVYLEPIGGIFGGRPDPAPSVRPVLYGRAFLGGLFGANRAALSFGPSLALGLCAGDQCAVIEAELPILEDQFRAAGRTYTFRVVNLAVRLQVRPLRIGDVTLGVTFGVLSRFGGAWISEGPPAFEGGDRLVVGVGTRQSVELAWNFEGPFAWVLEGGLDVALDPAHFVLAPGVRQVLEDELNGWLLTALRVWP
jgi:hypothetical protein